MIKKITILLFIALLSTISYKAISYGSGPPTGSAGAPSEATCIQSGCHTGSPITSGSNWDNVTLTSNFSTGNGYLPDSTYLIKLSHTVSGVSKWGFQITVLDTVNNKVVGTLNTITSASREQKSAPSREYIFHTSTGTSSTSSNTTVWTFNWKAPKTNVGAVKFYTCVMAANGNSTNDNDPVYVKNFRIKPSDMIPVANAKCKDSTHCAGTAITLEGASTAVTGNMTWTWTSPQATFISPSTKNSQNPVVRYANPGSYWAILSVSNGKAASTKTDSIKITVLSVPTFSTNPNAGTYTICKGDSLQLKSTGSASYTYNWSNGSKTQNIFVKDTGNYTVTSKSTNGCTFTPGVIKIAHNPIYKVNLTRDVSNDTVCFERPVKLTATGTPTVTFDSIFYYTTAGGLLQKTINNPETFKFSSSTDIYARGKDSKKCLTAASNKLNFVVKKGVAAPTASCQNKSTSGFEISWGAVTGALGYKVSLDSGKTWQTPSTGNTGLSHKVTGFPVSTDVEVWLKALDISPCNESEISMVKCGSIPCSPLSYDIVWDKDACKGKAVNFKIRNLTTNFYSITIDGGAPKKDTAFTMTADASRTYKFELTDSANLACPTIKRDAAVKVWEITPITLSVPSLICAGDTVKISATPTGMQEYNFFLNGLSQQKSNVPQWAHSAPKSTDSVWTVISNGACMETSKKINLDVKPKPDPHFTFSNAGRVVTFVPTQLSNTNYAWDFGDGKADTARKPIHTYAGTVAEKVWAVLVVKNSFGCMSFEQQEVSLPAASISDAFKKSGINVYPQPAKNSFKVEVPADLINAKISLMDATGRVLYKAIADKKVTEIMTTEIPNGIYMLLLEKGNEQFNGKVIISR